LRGEGDWDLELVMAILVLGFKGAAGRGPPDPLLGPDPRQESVRGCRDGDGPCAKDVPVCGATPQRAHTG